MLQYGRTRGNSHHRQQLEQLFSGGDQPQGEWVKPEEAPDAPPTLEAIDKKMEELRQELGKLAKLREQLADVNRLNAISRIRSIMLAHDIKPEEIESRKRRSVTHVDPGKGATFTSKNTPRPDKYRKGENGWCGMGKRPDWVHEVIAKEGGKQALEKYRVDLH